MVWRLSPAYRGCSGIGESARLFARLRYPCPAIFSDSFHDVNKQLRRPRESVKLSLVNFALTEMQPTTVGWHQPSWPSCPRQVIMPLLLPRGTAGKRHAVWRSFVSGSSRTYFLGNRAAGAAPLLGGNWPSSAVCCPLKER